MQIVIEINEDAYNLLEQKYRNGKADVLDCIILNGNILPKNHGRLIDADKLELDDGYSNYDGHYHTYSSEAIYYAPTIIEGSESE